MSETRAFAVGEFTSNLAACYIDYLSGDESDTDGPGGRSKEQEDEGLKLQRAFRHLGIRVSANQVHQILEAARQHRNVSPSDKASCASASLSWSEFCIFTIELLFLSKSQSQSDAAANRANSTFKRKDTSTRTEKSLAMSSAKCEVFLGGSCNPTTWRKDTAIPFLQQNKITYYNPQVDEWSSELIEIEEQAKTTANILLFVVDKQTRAVSSLVEVAYLSSIGREVVVVMMEMAEDSTVGSDALSKREIDDLNRGRVFLRRLTENHNTLVTDTLEEALQAVVEVLQKNTTLAEYKKRNHPLRLNHTHHLGEHTRLIQQAFEMYDTYQKGTLNLQEAEIALRSLRVPHGSLSNLLSESSSLQHLIGQQWQASGLTLTEFCTVYAELKHSQMHLSRELEQTSVYYSIFKLLSSGWVWLSSWLQTPPPPPSLSSSSTHLPPSTCHAYDVFLGGACGSTTWRSDVVIPILRQYGVSYFNPQVPNWNTKLIPIEHEAKENCAVLLFVIGTETLGVASLVEVSHYIGRRRQVVLCLSRFTEPDNTRVADINLSKQAIKDYNRGRSYLASIANKSRVPLFSSIADAAVCAVQMVNRAGVTRAMRPPMLYGTSV